jgi:hypothetical protein
MPLNAPGARQPPLPVPKRQQRADQRLVPLAGCERRHGDQVQWISRTTRDRCAIGPRFDDRDPIWANAIAPKHSRGPIRCHNRGACRRECRSLAFCEPVGLPAVDADLSRERQMDERDQVQSRTFALSLRRHRPEREAVNDDCGVVGNRGEHLCRMIECRHSRPGKAGVELFDVDDPSALPQACGHAPVVLVSAGSLADRTWNKKDERPHTRPSNEADAR